MAERDNSELEEETHEFHELCTPRIHLNVEGHPTVTSDEQVNKSVEKWDSSSLYLTKPLLFVLPETRFYDLCLTSFVSWKSQVKVESTIEHLLENFLEHHELDPSLPQLNRLQIVDFVRHGLSKLSTSYEVLLIFEIFKSIYLKAHF